MANNFFILASGEGSNAERLAHTAQEQDFPLKGLICDRPGAPVLQRMERLKVPHWALPFPPSREGNLVKRKKIHEEKMLELIQSVGGTGDKTWLFLAGYRRLLSSDFLKHFFDETLGVARVVNIHPSLLPLFPGLKSYARAYHAGVQESGCTVHFVDEGLDTGPHIVQNKFVRPPGCSFEEFQSLGLNLEHQTYPQVLKDIMGGVLP